MKRILVTGASGRIGRRVVPLLLDRGYAVRCLVHRTPLPSDWANEVESVGMPEESVAGVHAIIHLAGVMPPASDDEVFQTNIEGTRRLLRAASERGKPRFLFASSDATYCTGWSLTGYTEPIDEDAAHHPTVFYGLSKVLGERMALYYQEMGGVPAVRLRFVWTLDAPEILGLFTKAPYKDFTAVEERSQWERNRVVAIPLEQDGSPFTEHICDARDAAEAVVLALESENAPGQAFNIAGPAPFQYTKVGPALACRLGAEPVALRCAGIHSYSLSIEKARNLIGYAPKYRVEDSLDEAINLCPKP